MVLSVLGFFFLAALFLPSAGRYRMPCGLGPLAGHATQDGCADHQQEKEHNTTRLPKIASDIHSGVRV